VPEDLRAETALRRCGITHVLLPCFVLAGRLDVAETIGTVLEESGRRPGRRATGGSTRRCLSLHGTLLAAAVL